ncbi:MAG: monofunctional biosynthetic peptidoglycan transglycosylase [Nitrospirae bacterium]|nr:monofunctional biosynthetic peptidoglycan transglycosylase [Nitrospirota bacterium]MDA8215631.1 monofunctional biosynthetic peptidoglycan transglycosylase [Nitrospiraceae bacterium]
MSKVKIIVLLLISAIFLSIAYYFIFPDISELKKENPKKTSFMEYREKEWKEKGKKIKTRQVWVPISQISPYLVKAVLIAEDDKFWHHEGFDFEAMQKAIEKDIKEKKFKFGGSTISQQLAKNLYLTPSKNPIRKIKEAILTWRVESNLSKKRILELYLNVAEWGEGIFGIEAATRHYYGKPASALIPEEAARLASVLPNPRKYNPLGTSKYVENRSKIIYAIMVKRGIVIPAYEEVMETSNAQGKPAQDNPPSPEDMKSDSQKDMVTNPVSVSPP